MNSEVQQEQQTAQIKAVIEQKEAQKKADSKVQGEADLAGSFERNTFWQVMKKDLEDEVSKMVEIILTKELSKTQIDKLKTHIQAIRQFIESPKKYLKNLKAMNQRYTKRV